jgi:hypothetical protein
MIYAVPSPAEAKYSPEGENRTQFTDFMCFVRVARYSTRICALSVAVASSDKFPGTTLQIYIN